MGKSLLLFCFSRRNIILTWHEHTYVVRLIFLWKREKRKIASSGFFVFLWTDWFYWRGDAVINFTACLPEWLTLCIFGFPLQTRLRFLHRRRKSLSFSPCSVVFLKSHAISMKRPFFMSPHPLLLLLETFYYFTYDFLYHFLFFYNLLQNPPFFSYFG